MLKLDHLALPVSDWTASRDWYVGTLGHLVRLWDETSMKAH